jgi:hypothetical protein
MLSVSLPGRKGSIYSKNFYDIFTKQIDEDGKPYVEFSRYSSALSPNEAIEKIRKIDPDYWEEADDAYFLAHPIKIDAKDEKLLNADTIHKFLHKEHETTLTEDMLKIIQYSRQARQLYIETLLNNPDADKVLLAFNAILNISDKVANKIKLQKVRNGEVIYSSEESFDMFKKIPQMTKADIFAVGRLQVKQIDTGCGSSGGYTVNANSMLLMSSIYGNPYSVAAFGLSDETKNTREKILKCTCPFCNRKVEAIIKDDTITCPKCKKSVSYKC